MVEGYSNATKDKGNIHFKANSALLSIIVYFSFVVPQCLVTGKDCNTE